MFKKCTRCRKEKLWFRIKKRSYIAPSVSQFPIESNTEICKSCMNDVEFLTLQKWHLKHYWKYRKLIIKHNYSKIKGICGKLNYQLKSFVNSKND